MDKSSPSVCPTRPIRTEKRVEEEGKRGREGQREEEKGRGKKWKKRKDLISPLSFATKHSTFIIFFSSKRLVLFSLVFFASSFVPPFLLSLSDPQPLTLSS
jgi:hypothetical protein